MQEKKSFPVGKLAGFIAVFVVIVVVFLLLNPHYYIMKRVEPDEIGIKQRSGQITDIVGPGIYSDFGFFVKLDKYSTASLNLDASDPEVITKDQQRIGVTVYGTAFRPDLTTDEETIKRLWTKYKTIYSNDVALQDVFTKQAFQAMKVCTGDRLFEDAVVGSDRDDLRICIDQELNDLMKPYGITVMNVAVPNVVLGESVQAKLDAITQSRLDTEKAEQDRLKAIAEGAAQQAKQEADIRVEQSVLQEKARQAIILAALEKDQLEAEMKVIEAEKANQLLAAQKDLEIYEATALAAAEKAKADLAEEIALALLFQENPNYYFLQMATVNASAIKNSDKLIFTPEGVFPQLVFGEGLSPVVPVGGTTE